MKSLKEIIDFLVAKKLKLTDGIEFHTNIHYDFESDKVRDLILAGPKSCFSG